MLTKMCRICGVEKPIWNCNVAIGKLGDNPDAVLNAYKYLKGELK